MLLNRILAFGTCKLLSTSSYSSITSKMANLEAIRANNQLSKTVIASLQNELVAVRAEMLNRMKEQLREENAALQKKVEAAKQQLIALEISHGKQQIALPNTRGLCTEATAPVAESARSNNVKPVVAPVAATETPQKAATKEKKPKKEKPAASNASATAAAATELPIDVGRLDMRVGKIIDVSLHPDANSLYVEKIDCGEEKPRTVVSGLVKFVPLEELKNRMVIIMCNLKPAKMRGVTSEAMVMCASTPEKVEVLLPPANAAPGDLVHCVGYTRQPDAQLNPKKKIFETCAPDLMTNGDLVACYKGAPLYVPDKGNIAAATLANVNVK